MKSITPAALPQKRAQDLIIDGLFDEVLVYDLELHRAHCLNHTAALVWEQCDGKSTTAEIALRLETNLNTKVSPELVLLALNQLEKNHLLTKFSSKKAFAGISRREMIRSLGIAAVTLPVVTSIVSPSPAEAATCAGSGGLCGSGISCCFGHVCSGGRCT